MPQRSDEDLTRGVVIFLFFIYSKKKREQGKAENKYKDNEVSATFDKASGAISSSLIS